MPIMEYITAADHALFFLVNNSLSNPFFDVVFTNATEAKFWIVPGIAAAVLFALKKRREALIVLALVLVTAAVTDVLASQLIKPLVHRDRPCPPGFFIEGGRFLCGSKHSPSFPSSHAMNMFGLAMLLTFFYPRRAWIFFLFACFIGYSRVYVGVHYPVDVVAGAVFGAAVGAAVALVWRMSGAWWKMAMRPRRSAGAGTSPPSPT